MHIDRTGDAPTSLSILRHRNTGDPHGRNGFCKTRSDTGGEFDMSGVADEHGEGVGTMTPVPLPPRVPLSEPGQCHIVGVGRTALSAPSRLSGSQLEIT